MEVVVILVYAAAVWVALTLAYRISVALTVYWFATTVGRRVNVTRREARKAALLSLFDTSLASVSLIIAALTPDRDVEEAASLLRSIEADLSAAASNLERADKSLAADAEMLRDLVERLSPEDVAGEDARAALRDAAAAALALRDAANDEPPNLATARSRVEKLKSLLGGLQG